MFATKPNTSRRSPVAVERDRSEVAPRAKQSAQVNPLWQSLALRPLGIQPKLTVSHPNDPFEQEADHVADQVMRMATSPSGESRLLFSSHSSREAQRKCASCEEEEEKTPQRKEQGGSARSSFNASPMINAALNAPGRPLNRATRSFFEPRFGRDFSQVRVHTDEPAAQSAQEVNARAYTIGRHVVFGRSQYNPESTSGRILLAHELAHTIQQGQGVKNASSPVVAPQTDGPIENDPGRGPRVPVADITSQASPNGETVLARDGMDAGVPDAGIQDASTVSGGVPMPDAGSSTTAPSATPTYLTTPTAPAVPNVYEHNTELGGLSVGNFDFHFNECRILIWVWVKFKFESGITAAVQTAFKTRFFTAIHGVWGNSGYHLTGTAACPCRDIPIMVHAQESTGSSYHKLVDVERAARRNSVISDMNLSLATSDTTMAHEFGHVLGLYDEYDGGWIENHMFWHRNRTDDPSALMNSGTGLRERYFEHYRGRVQETAGANCDYTVSSPTPPVP